MGGRSLRSILRLPQASAVRPARLVLSCSRTVPRPIALLSDGANAGDRDKYADCKYLPAVKPDPDTRSD